jgi:hypothetical protein
MDDFDVPAFRSGRRRLEQPDECPVVLGDVDELRLHVLVLESGRIRDFGGKLFPQLFQRGLVGRRRPADVHCTRIPVSR